MAVICIGGVEARQGGVEALPRAPELCRVGTKYYEVSWKLSMMSEVSRDLTSRSEVLRIVDEKRIVTRFGE